MDKKSGQSKFFFGAHTGAGGSLATVTSLNSEQIRLALDVNGSQSKNSLLEFNIDNPGSMCNKEIHLLWHNGRIQVLDHCLKASDDYNGGKIKQFYQGMVHSARVSLHEKQSMDVTANAANSGNVKIK